MNDNNKKKRNRNPKARQKAFEAKFLNQVFGDLRCTAVSIEQTEYAGKSHNYPVLTLTCTACGSTIKRRADRKFDPVCRAGFADPEFESCQNFRLNKQIREMITRIKRSAQDYEPEFVEFYTLKAWLLGQGFKAGDTRTLRKRDPNLPLSAANALLWTGKGQPGRFVLADGTNIDLKKICRERRFKYDTALRRYRRGIRELDKLVPQFDFDWAFRPKSKPVNYADAMPPKQWIIGNKAIHFKNGSWHTMQEFCDHYDLDYISLALAWNENDPATWEAEFYRKYAEQPEYRSWRPVEVIQDFIREEGRKGTAYYELAGEKPRKIDWEAETRRAIAKRKADLELQRGDDETIDDVAAALDEENAEEEGEY